jgi:hypothetical protein
MFRPIYLVSVVDAREKVLVAADEKPAPEVTVEAVVSAVGIRAVVVLEVTSDVVSAPEYLLA